MKKITLLLFILFAITGLNQARAQNKPDKNSVTGSWLGKLEVSAISLRIVFNLSVIEKDSLVATMDSPDQGAKGIKLGPVIIDNENIKISAPLLLGEYSGTIKNDTIIEGTWTQRGNTLPLNLTKLRKAFAVNRPQEPKPPFPYATEDVKFTNEKAGISLAGTITIPQGEGPFPAVILITGSGSQNRNEELKGHKPFWVIADHLSRNGIAVLRYDDRGVGQSQGTPLNATAADFATDAGAAFSYLRTRKEIDQESVGLAGHSEGGLVASLVASDNHEIAFIISLAGQGVTGEKISLRQNKDIGVASGIDETEIKEANAINKKLYAVLKKESDDKKAEEKMTAAYKKLLIKKKAKPEEIEQALNQLSAGLNPASYPWFRFYLMTDPADYWKKISCPVLALNGEKDLQVAADENLPAIEKAVKSGGNQNVKTMKFPELNHLFQHSKTGLPAEYGEIEETFAPEVLKIMSDWIHGL